MQIQWPQRWQEWVGDLVLIAALGSAAAVFLWATFNYKRCRMPDLESINHKLDHLLAHAHAESEMLEYLASLLTMSESDKTRLTTLTGKLKASAAKLKAAVDAAPVPPV